MTNAATLLYLPLSILDKVKPGLELMTCPDTQTSVGQKGNYWSWASPISPFQSAESQKVNVMTERLRKR